MNKTGKNIINVEIDNNQIPETPKVLIARALLFVPGIYIILLISAVLSALIGIAIVTIIYFIAEAINIIPTGIILAIIIGVVIGICAVIKAIVSTIWRRPDFELALLIKENEEKIVFSFITDMCGLMETKKPDHIIIHSEPVFYVKQGNIEVFNGEAKGRILAIGLPLLEFLSLNEFRAILAHEFAHFTGNDTKYSVFVLPVYVGSITAIREMNSTILSREESFGNFLASIPLYLPYQMLTAYLNRFSEIDMSISRSREKRADSIACLMCGTNSFTTGLRKATSIGLAFQDISKMHILKELENKKAFVNYYKTFQEVLLNNKNIIEEYENEILSKNDESEGSHPTLRRRLEEVPHVPNRYNDEKLAKEIFNKINEYEEILTGGYTQIVKARNDYEKAYNNIVNEIQAKHQEEIEAYRKDKINKIINDPSVKMICTNCGSAYCRNDIAECADCGAPLVSKQKYLTSRKD